MQTSTGNIIGRPRPPISDTTDANTALAHTTGEASVPERDDDWAGGVEPGGAAAERLHPYWQMVAAFKECALPDVSPLTDAGVWDAVLGAGRCVAADERLARHLAEAEPRLVWCAREHSRFAGRALRWLVGQGVRQFVDLGCGVGDLTAHLDPPVRDPIRVARVDVHPLVVARLRERHRRDPRTAIIEADLRRPHRLLTDPALHELIDFGQPVAILAVVVLQHLTDAGDPAAIIRQLRELVVPGSYLVLSHPDLNHPALPRTGDRALAAAYAHHPADWVRRGRDELRAWLDDWTPIDPGITQVARWRPEPDSDPPHEQELADGLGWAVVATATADPPAGIAMQTAVTVHEMTEDLLPAIAGGSTDPPQPDPEIRAMAGQTCTDARNVRTTR